MFLFNILKFSFPPMFPFKCPKHSLNRAKLFSKINRDNFQNFSDREKISFLRNDPEIVKLTAQFIIDSFDNRIPD